MAAPFQETRLDALAKSCETSEGLRGRIKYHQSLRQHNDQQKNESLFILELPVYFGEVVFLSASLSLSLPRPDKTRKYCWTRLTKRSPSSAIVTPYWTSIHWYDHTPLYFSFCFVFS